MIALLATTALWAGGCPGGGPPPALSGQATSGDLLATLRVDTRIVRPGDEIHVTLTARNTGSKPMLVEAGTSATILVTVWRYDMQYGWRRVIEYPETALYQLTSWTLQPGAKGERTFEMPLTVGKAWPMLTRAKLTAEVNGRPGARPFVFIEVLPELTDPQADPSPPGANGNEEAP